MYFLNTNSSYEDKLCIKQSLAFYTLSKGGTPLGFFKYTSVKERVEMRAKLSGKAEVSTLLF
jgi:hypothetical protein